MVRARLAARAGLGCHYRANDGHNSPCRQGKLSSILIANFLASGCAYAFDHSPLSHL